MGNPTKVNNPIPSAFFDINGKIFDESRQKLKEHQVGQEIFTFTLITKNATPIHNIIT